MIRWTTLLVGAVAVATMCLVSNHSTDAGSNPQVKPRTDASGDPLPQGAIARMGSLRMRHGADITFIAFTPNGKAVLTGALDNSLKLWDRETGKEIRRFDPPAAPANPNVRRGVMVYNPYGRGLSRALSADGKLLAAVTPNNTIQIFEVESGKEIRQPVMPRIAIATILFAPDGKLLAARGNDRTTYLLDSETGRDIRQIKTAAGGAVRFVAGQGPLEASGVAFSPDGKSIATAEVEFGMQMNRTYIKITETDTGKEIRQIDNSPSGASAIAYSPDGKILAYGSGAAIQLREADTGKEIRKVEAKIVSAALVFSPDSGTLASKGRDGMVRLFETSSGKTLHELGETAGAAQNINQFMFLYNMTETRDLAFSPDGKVITTGGGQTLRVWNVSTGKEQPLSGGHKGAVSAITITPDGKTMLSRGADNTVRRWNALTGAELGAIKGPSDSISATFAPDGKTVAHATADGTILLMSAADDTRIHSFRGNQRGLAAVAFSPDSKLLASQGSFDNIIRIFDTIKGGEVRQISLAGLNMAGGGNVFIAGAYRAGGGSGLAFAPDGQTLAAYVPVNQYAVRNPGGQPAPVNDGNTLRLWDVATGKETRKINLPIERGVTNIAFSPDGRLIATENSDQTVSLWELASGRERARLGDPQAAGPLTSTGVVIVGGGFGRVNTAAAPAGVTLGFAPDGSVLAVRGPSNSIRVWDVNATKEIGTFKGHDGAIASIAFAPDGKAVASGSADTTILVWDVASLKREARPAPGALQQKELDALWADLISDDANRAGRAVLTVASAAKLTVPYLRARLKPATPPDVKKIDQWIADLDSSNFTKRSKAIEELEKLGELAVPALRKVLTSQASLEVRRRVEPLLEKLTTGNLSAEQVRYVRAIEALEQMGTQEARQLLQALAEGAPGALQTRQAQAALDFLARRSASR